MVKATSQYKKIEAIRSKAEEGLIPEDMYSGGINAKAKYSQVERGILITNLLHEIDKHARAHGRTLEWDLAMPETAVNENGLNIRGADFRSKDGVISGSITGYRSEYAREEGDFNDARLYTEVAYNDDGETCLDEYEGLTKIVKGWEGTNHLSKLKRAGLVAAGALAGPLASLNILYALHPITYDQATRTWDSPSTTASTLSLALGMAAGSALYAGALKLWDKINPFKSKKALKKKYKQLMEPRLPKNRKWEGEGVAPAAVLK